MGFYLPYGLAACWAFATAAGEGWPGNRTGAEEEPPEGFGEAAGAEETFIAATPLVSGSVALRASMDPPRIMRPIREAKKVVIILGFTYNTQDERNASGKLWQQLKACYNKIIVQTSTMSSQSKNTRQPILRATLIAYLADVLN
jgi:hypothetical protein